VSGGGGAGGNNMQIKQSQRGEFEQAIKMKAAEYMAAVIKDDGAAIHHHYDAIYEIARLAKAVLEKEDDEALSADE
jgi:hypothetical protein